MEISQGPLYDMRGLGFTSGEVVVITGSGSGIGRATALAAARSGLNVAVWDLAKEGAVQTVKAVEELGAAALCVVVDITDEAAVADAWQQTLALGRCSYLVNNAGPPSSSTEPFAENLLSAVGSVEQVTRQWLAHCADVAASVVNVVSIAGNFHGNGKTVAPFYPTAKAGIAGLTRYLATRHDGRPRANAVAPGITITRRIEPILDNPVIGDLVSRVPVGRLGNPEEIASAILFLLSPAASYINGVVLPVDGGVTLT